MSINKTAYFIKIVETDIDKPDIDIDGIMADEFEETLIFVGRLIEKLHNDVNFKGKYIYVVQYLLSSDEYIKQDNLFSCHYLIED
jgi:hypothetical protein